MKEFYESQEYKKIDEYKKFKAEQYRPKKEYCAPNKELTRTPEENNAPQNPIPKNNGNSGDSASSLKDMLSKVGQTSTSLVTTTAIVASVGAAVVAPEIFLPSSTPPPVVYPNVLMETIDIGNDFFTYDINIDNNDNDYKLYITNTNNNELVETINLNKGANKDFIKGLLPSTSYSFKVFSEVNEKTLYDEVFTTLDGSKPMFVYDIKEYLARPYVTSIEYEIYISDPLDLYDQYSIVMQTKDQEGEDHVGFDFDETITKSFKRQLEFCPMEPIIFNMYGLKEPDGEVLIEKHTFVPKSIAPIITSFPLTYSVPLIDDISYVYLDREIRVDIPLIFVPDDEYVYFVEVNATDELGNVYSDLAYNSGASLHVPDTTKSLTFEYQEYSMVDDIRTNFKKGSIDGTLTFKETLTKDYIGVSQSNNKFQIELTPSMRKGSKIIISDETNNRQIENTTGHYEATLPTSVTTYSYQLYSANNEPLGDKETFVIDPSLYNVATADTFIPMEPRKVTKSFNDDGTWNLYLYSAFTSTNPNLSWITILKDGFSSLGTKDVYYESKAKALEIPFLNEEHCLEYIIGENHNGVYYEAERHTTNYDTMSDTEIYKGMTSKEKVGNQTKITFNFDATGTSNEFNGSAIKYDFDGTKMYIGNYTPILLNNSDFTFDPVTNTYKYEIIVDGDVAWYDFYFKANNNLYKIDNIKNVMPIRGNLCGPVSLYGYVNNGGAM